MKNTVSRVLLTVAMVAAIVGLVCIVVSMMNLGTNWVLIAGQICVAIGLFLTTFTSYQKKAKKN